MANWSNPLLTSTYTSFVDEVKDRDVDLALQFNNSGTLGSGATNVPTNAIGWDASAKRWKTYNGTTWAELADPYNLTSVAVTSATAPTNGIYLPATNTVGISTGGTGKVFVTSDGNVGIGTANPDDKLHVSVGGIKLSWGQYRIASIFDNDYRQGIAFDAGGRQLQIFSTTNDAGGSIGLYTRVGTGASGTDYGTERLRVTATGDVNIKGAGTAGSTQAVSFSGSAPVDSLVVTSAGRVGLGTNNPSNTLDVNGTARFRLGGTNQLVVSTDSGNPYLYVEQNAPLNFGTNSQIRATLNSSGYLTGTVNGLSSGIYPSKQYYRLNADYTGSNVNTAQSLFGVGVTLIGSTQYEFECLMILQAASITTATTVSFDFGGTATINNIAFMGTGPGITGKPAFGGYDGTPTSFYYTSATGGDITATNAAGIAAVIDLVYLIKGTVSINAGGTFIPRYKFSSAPGNAWVTAAGSYFSIWPLGASGSNISIGSWAA